jgi:hypothetical protein
LLFRQLQEFAALHGHLYITEFDVDAARRFRASWPNKNIAARKKLEAFRAFFRLFMKAARFRQIRQLL